MRNALEWILLSLIVTVIMAFLVWCISQGQENRKHECEQAGGVWLPRNVQCLPKENK